MDLIEKLKFVAENDFERLTYSGAVEILKNSNHYKKKKFQFPVEWGVDLQSEHERYLVERHFKKPVILIDYPKEIKAFYMKQNDDGKTVAAMDVLFPQIGEIIGDHNGRRILINWSRVWRKCTFPWTSCGGISIPAVSARFPQRVRTGI